MQYVIEGPVKIGNVFGYYGFEVLAGKFAVVENGEYTNGGYGPSQAVKGVFATREEANKAVLRQKGS